MTKKEMKNLMSDESEKALKEILIKMEIGKEYTSNDLVSLQTIPFLSADSITSYISGETTIRSIFNLQCINVYRDYIKRNKQKITTAYAEIDNPDHIIHITSDKITFTKVNDYTSRPTKAKRVR